MNPWKEVALFDYEEHMKQKGVYQQQTLNKLMGEQMRSYEPADIVILGIAGGNGLDQVNLTTTKTIYGVDINPRYLETCKRRYRCLEDRLNLIEADLTREEVKLPEAELVIADLFVEYIGIEIFTKQIQKSNAKVVSVVIQKDGSEGFVSESPYQKKLDILSSVHTEIDSGKLTEAMEKAGYQMILQEAKELPNQKQLIRFDYKNTRGVL